MFADDFIPIPSSYLGVIIELKCYGQGVWTSTSAAIVQLSFSDVVCISVGR